MLSLDTRFRILRRCGFKCVYCGRSAQEIPLQVDHLQPVALNGTDDDANLIAACRDCNLGKSANAITSRAEPLTRAEQREMNVLELWEDHDSTNEKLGVDDLAERKLTAEMAERLRSLRAKYNLVE